MNRRGPTVYGAGASTLPELSIDDVARLHQDGAWIVDTRPISAFASGHIPGSVSIALRDVFATWLGWVVPDDVPLVFVLDADQDRDLLVREARKVGYERLAGELAGGVESWVLAGYPVERLPLIPAAGADGAVVDVRQCNEFEAGHVPGAVHAELGAIASGAASLPSGPLSVMCAHGERAMSAGSLLARDVHREVTVLTGGPDEWAAAHHVALGTA